MVRQSWQFHLGAGALCLDFANTVSWRGSEAPVDHLPAYEELVRFALQSKLIAAAEAGRLRREATRRPEGATRALRRAVALREALYRMFAGLAAGRRLSPADVATLNTSLPAALASIHVVHEHDRFTWAWAGDRGALERLVWPVARDAAVFLTSTDLSRLRTCGNPRCRWLFLDATRNRTRRWCTMAVCGNRAKVHRYRQRHRRHRPRGA
jgi:predicted RNA-binding Zn ribbon-like protein